MQFFLYIDRIRLCGDCRIGLRVYVCVCLFKYIVIKIVKCALRISMWAVRMTSVCGGDGKVSNKALSLLF